MKFQSGRQCNRVRRTSGDNSQVEAGGIRIREISSIRRYRCATDRDFRGICRDLNGVSFSLR